MRTASFEGLRRAAETAGKGVRLHTSLYNDGGIVDFGRSLVARLSYTDALRPPYINLRGAFGTGFRSLICLARII